jgi:hypothetical protein
MPRLSTPMPSSGNAAPGPAQLPSPQELAALGTLLCLYRAHAGGELGGWQRAVRVAASALLDSDGMRECLVFRDAAGETCWQLFLLPDSDFLAWEQLSARLPAQRGTADAHAGLAERMLQRLSGRARLGEWQASVLRLHARSGPGGTGTPMLAATLASVSPLGAAAARGIARSQHADARALDDDCCCARAARATIRAGVAGDDTFPPLVRLSRPDRN